MALILVLVVIVLAAALSAVSAAYLRTGAGPGVPGRGALGRRRAHAPPASGHGPRILFPFTPGSLAARALDAALRLAAAEQATLVPVFLAHVGLRLPLEAPLPRQSDQAIRLQEAIEQRAAAFGVPVDARIERGRTLRHALRQTIEHERYDRLVIAAARDRDPGLHADVVAWLLENAPGEIVVLRPAGPAAATAVNGEAAAVAGGR